MEETEHFIVVIALAIVALFFAIVAFVVFVVWYLGLKATYKHRENDSGVIPQAFIHRPKVEEEEEEVKTLFKLQRDVWVSSRSSMPSSSKVPVGSRFPLSSRSSGTAMASSRSKAPITLDIKSASSTSFPLASSSTRSGVPISSNSPAFVGSNMASSTAAVRSSPLPIWSSEIPTLQSRSSNPIPVGASPKTVQAAWISGNEVHFPLSSTRNPNSHAPGVCSDR